MPGTAEQVSPKSVLRKDIPVSGIIWYSVSQENAQILDTQPCRIFVFHFIAYV
jgi:hypothetical protein